MRSSFWGILLHRLLIGTVTSSGPMASFDSQLLHLVTNELLTQYVCEPTRFAASQRFSLLDLLITKSHDVITELQYLAPWGQSDHVLLHFTYSFPLAAPTWNLGRYHNVWKADHNNMRTAASTIPVATLLPCDVYERWKMFAIHLRELLYRFTPINRSRPTKHRPPWLSRDVGSVLKQKASR